MDMEPYSMFFSNETVGGIKRLALKDSAVVEVIRIESPSSIFVRPRDHIRDLLVYREPYQMTAVEECLPGHFALAPLDGRAFGRCIIVRNISEDLYKVFFIDEAITASVFKNCLFEVEESQMCIPWQVMHVTLGRLVNLSGDEWSFDQCRDFASIISNFDYFEITASQVDLSTEPDRPSILVSMYGLEHMFNEGKKVSIEEFCATAMQDVMVSIFPVNVMVNPQLNDLDFQSESNIEPFRLELPSDWAHDTAQNHNSEEVDWAITNRIPNWNMTELKKYIMADGCFNCLVEMKEIASPSEMIIYPILPRNEHDTEQWLLDELNEINFYLRCLNDFYLNIKNQKPLSYDEIKNALENGKVYAVVEPILSGKWSRCEILELLTQNNANVRFLDTGRKCVQNLKTLFKMHRIHTLKLPFTIECGRAPPENRTPRCSEKKQVMAWPKKHCIAWKQIVPFDVPLVVGPEIEFLENGKLQIYSLKYLQEERNIFDEMPPPTKEDFEQECE